MKVIGASTELVTTPAMKVQERLAGGQHWEQTTCFSNCDDAQQVTEEKARFMSESDEEVCYKSFRNNEK